MVSQQEDFDRSLKDLHNLYGEKSTIILRGDFIFEDIDWNNVYVHPGAYQRQASQMLIESLNDHHPTST